MLILDRVILNSLQSPLRSGALREFAMRQDRLPADQQVDLPEIQESFRVSFSDAALAASAEGVRDVMQKPRPTMSGVRQNYKCGHTWQLPLYEYFFGYLISFYKCINTNCLIGFNVLRHA